LTQPHDMKILAYEIWCACGQNLSECERLLKSEHNFKISRQTLTEWKEKYDWQGRAARAEAEQADQAEDISDGAIMKTLLVQKKKYDIYFENLPVRTVDNQSLYAYSNLLKKIVDMRSKDGGGETIDRPKIFLEDLDFIAHYLHENDPEGLKAFGRNIDAIVSRFKESHAQAS